MEWPLSMQLNILASKPGVSTQTEHGPCLVLLNHTQQRTILEECYFVLKPCKGLHSTGR